MASARSSRSGGCRCRTPIRRPKPPPTNLASRSTSGSVRPARWCSCGTSCRRSRCSPIPLFLVVLRLDAAPRRGAGLVTRGRATAWGRRASSSRWRATTATCCSTSSALACQCSASSRRPTSPPWRGTSGTFRPSVEFFGRDLAARLVAEGRRADVHARSERHGARPRSERLHERDRDDAGARWRRGDRSAVRARHGRAHRVRHDLSRASLLLLRARRRAARPPSRSRARAGRARPDSRRVSSFVHQHAASATATRPSSCCARRRRSG